MGETARDPLKFYDQLRAHKGRQAKVALARTREGRIDAALGRMQRTVDRAGNPLASLAFRAARTTTTLGLLGTSLLRQGGPALKEANARYSERAKMKSSRARRADRQRGAGETLDRGVSKLLTGVQAARDAKKSEAAREHPLRALAAARNVASISLGWQAGLGVLKTVAKYTLTGSIDGSTLGGKALLAGRAQHLAASGRYVGGNARAYLDGGAAAKAKRGTPAAPPIPRAPGRQGAAPAPAGSGPIKVESYTRKGITVQGYSRQRGQ